MITDFCKFQQMQNFLFILLFLLSCSESNDSATGPNGSNVSCDDPMLFMLEDLNTTSSTYSINILQILIGLRFAPGRLGQVFY